MKPTRGSLKVLSLVLLLAFCCPPTFAQSHNLPPQLSGNSTLRETLSWLDNHGLRDAIVGFDSGNETAVFNRGFRLAKVEGCRLTLRSEDIKVLSFSTAAYPGEPESLESFRTRVPGPTLYPAELYVMLNKLDPKRGRRPHLRTRAPEDAKIFGSWQSEFKSRHGRLRDLLLLVIFDGANGVWKSHMYAANITFAFENQGTSEHFDAAFRHAVGLCNMK